MRGSCMPARPSQPALRDATAQQHRALEYTYDDGPTHLQVHLAITTCGDRRSETEIVVKSACLFKRPSTHLVFHLIADAQNRQPLTDMSSTYGVVLHASD